MPISVGDAVLTFLGDTTNLDQSFDKVKVGTDAAVKPGTLAVKDMGVAWDDAEIAASIATEKFTAAGRAAIRAGEEGALAGEQMAFSMHEAKGEIALLGEETGIRVPRHIRAFVAELPGVGVALNAAFSATAILMIVQLLVEGTKKLTEWVSETYIYTEATKEAYAEQLKLNGVINEQNIKIGDLKEKYEELGLKGYDLSKKKQEELVSSIDEEVKKRQEANDTIFLYNRYVRDTGLATKEQIEAVVEANKQLDAIPKRIELLQQQITNEWRKGELERLKEAQATSDAQIAAAKTIGEARLALALAQQKLVLAQQRANYSDLLAADNKFQEDKYQLELKSLNARLAVLQKDPTNNKDAIIAAQAAVRAATENHQALLTANLTKFLDTVNKLTATHLEGGVQVLNKQIDTIPITAKRTMEVIGGVLTDTTDIIVTDATRAVADINKAFEDLGIHGSFIELMDTLDRMRKGYDLLKKSGVASASDIMQAQIALMKAEMAVHENQGKNVEKERADIAKLTQTWKAYTSQIDIHNKKALLAATIFKTLGVDATQMGSKIQNAAIGTTAALASMFEAWGAGGVTVEQAMTQIVAAVLQGIAHMAFANATVELAKGFAAMAPTSPDFGHAGEHFTSAAIWFTAGAAASFVGGMISNAGSGGSSAASGNAGTSVTDNPSQVAPTPEVPVNVTNVQRFAGGGLISRPTLALVGDSMSSASKGAREAILPLENPEAMMQIGAALAPHLAAAGGSGGVTIHVEGLISPDNLGKVMTQINRRVKKGQGQLTSSSSLRVTKRSV